MCKTICIRKSILNNKSNDRKRINNYLNFLNKMNIALKEANETLYWLNLLRDTDYIHIDLYEKLAEIVKELIALLASCVKTLNNRLKSKNS